jgi:hypothetical protein
MFDYTSAVGHCRLTDSPASTNVAVSMLCAVDLAAALLDGLFEHPAELFDAVGDDAVSA